MTHGEQPDNSFNKPHQAVNKVSDSCQGYMNSLLLCGETQQQRNNDHDKARIDGTASSGCR